MAFIALNNVVGIVMGVLQLSQTVNGTIAALFVFNLYLGWTNSNSAVYIKTNFPIYYFGRLMGIMRLTMGISSLLLIGLGEIPKRWPSRGFDAIFISFIVLMVVGLIFPINGFIIARRKNDK